MLSLSRCVLIVKLVFPSASVLGAAVNVSASPFTLVKRYARTEMLVAAAKHHRRPIVFVNQVGGNDDLIFDGRSLVLDKRGTIIASATIVASVPLRTTFALPSSSTISPSGTSPLCE